MIDVVEVLQHWHAGRPKSVVASSLGIDAKTVRKYVAKAEEAGLVPGGAPLGRAEWAELVRGWFPGLVDARARSLTFPVIDAHRVRIKEMLASNTAATVFQRLRDEHELSVGISSFRLYVAAEFPEESLRDRVTVLRPDVEPGEEAQIDYGFLGTWLDPLTRRARRVWAFVMVLACSRHMFVRPVLSMDASSWVASHVAAFSFFGGAPRRLVPENVARHIFGVLCPPALCGRRRRPSPWWSGVDGRRRPARPHNDQSDASQLSSVSSVAPDWAWCGVPPKHRRFGVAQGLDLGFGVDLGVAVGRGEVGVAEPAADDVDLDAGLEQVDGGGVAEDVRADRAGRCGGRRGGRRGVARSCRCRSG